MSVISKFNKKTFLTRIFKNRHNMSGAKYKIVIIKTLVSGSLAKVIYYSDTKEERTTTPCIFMREIQASTVVCSSYGLVDAAFEQMYLDPNLGFQRKFDPINTVYVDIVILIQYHCSMQNLRHTTSKSKHKIFFKNAIISFTEGQTYSNDNTSNACEKNLQSILTCVEKDLRILGFV